MGSKAGYAFHLWNQVLVLGGGLVKGSGDLDRTLVGLDLLEGAVVTARGGLLLQ